MKFLNTIYGGWVKIFLTAILTMIISKGDLFAVTLKEVVSAGVLAILPLIINYLNPNDKRYGK